jgi:hypothetical protein
LIGFGEDDTIIFADLSLCPTLGLEGALNESILGHCGPLVYRYSNSA